MRVRELKRREVMGRVSRGEIGLRDAAALMEVSYRQAKRVWKRYGRRARRGWSTAVRDGVRTGAKQGSCDERAVALVREEVYGNGGEAIWSDFGG